MKPIIMTLEPKRLMGMKQEMSLAINKTSELFQKFMPRKNEINSLNSNFVFDLKEYPDNYFKEFNPVTSFIKWAAVEVESGTIIPEGMEAMLIESGKYAKFDVDGSFHDNSPFEYIFGTWVPNSEYMLDTKPHFDIMNTQIKDKQEIWIPIKNK